MKFSSSRNTNIQHVPQIPVSKSTAAYSVTTSFSEYLKPPGQDQQCQTNVVSITTLVLQN